MLATLSPSRQRMGPVSYLANVHVLNHSDTGVPHQACGIMPAMRLMLAAPVATSVIAIVAAVFAIWPVVADAPWEESSSSSRFTEAEVLALVRAEVDVRGCPSRRWAAERQGGGVWFVGTTCTSNEPSVDPQRSPPVWSFREAQERIIPLNEGASRSMR